MPGRWTSLVTVLGPFVARLLLWLPLLSLCCSPSPCSRTPSLKLHCTPSVSWCREVTWEGTRIVVAGASRRGFFSLRLLGCLASREKSWVAGFYPVMVQMSSYLGSYGPGRKILTLKLRTPTTSRLLHFQWLFINSLITLNTIFNGTKFSYAYMNFNFVRLITPEIVLYRSDVVFTSELAESWMKTPDGEWTLWNPEVHGATAFKRNPLLQTCTIWFILKTRRFSKLVTFHSYCFAMWFWQLLS
jgi:hypothetical protein